MSFFESLALNTRKGVLLGGKLLVLRENVIIKVY